MAGAVPTILFSECILHPPSPSGCWMEDVKLPFPLLVLEPNYTTTLIMVGPFKINKRDSINDTDFGLEGLYSNPFCATSKFCDGLLV